MFKIDKHLIKYVLGIGAMLFLFIFLVTCAWIGYGVKERCALARERYEGDCIEALIAWVEDDSTQTGKNGAIWALGQLGDERALSVLEGYYTGYEKVKGARGNWDEGISQYELYKAIKLLRGGTNISAFIWRNQLINK